jgi:hypothetical protein
MRIALLGLLMLIAAPLSAQRLGQEEGARQNGKWGPGYGFGPKDLILGVSGAVCTEIVWAVLRMK